MAITNILLGGASDFATSKHISTTFTEDLNDTFDAAAVKIKSLSTFWLNSYLSTVWDSFDSYTSGTVVGDTTGLSQTATTPSDTTGEFTLISQTGFIPGTTNDFTVYTTYQNVDWTLYFIKYYENNNTATQPYVSIAGTSPNKYMSIVARDDATTDVQCTAQATTRTLESNKHTFIHGNYTWYTYASPITVQCTFGTETVFSFGTYTGNQGSVSENFNIEIIAKGSDVYDIYYNGDLSSSDVTITGTPQLIFYSYCGRNPGSNGLYAIINVYDIIQAQEETA